MNEPTPITTPEPQQPEAGSNASSTPEIRDAAAAESTPAPAQNLPSPGTQLRRAREVAGQHVGVLAAMLKVPIAKIEALEADNYAALPDMVFARALAASVCRALKTDPAPIMAAFPAAAAPHIHADSGRINTPLQNSEQPHLGRSSDAASASRYLLYVVAFLLLAAAALFLAPYVLNGVSSRQPGQPASASNAAPQADTPGMTSFPVTTTILAPPDATAEDTTTSPANDAPAAETPSASAETPAAATAMPVPTPLPANAATQTTPAGASASNNRPAPPARPATPATQPARQP